MRAEVQHRFKRRSSMISTAKLDIVQHPYYRRTASAVLANDLRNSESTGDRDGKDS